MTLFQLIAVLFGLFMLYVINIHRRKARLTKIEVSFWYTTWFFFVLIALFPNLLLEISVALRFTRVFDLLVVIAFMVLSAVTITNYLALREVQFQLEQLVRDNAIANAVNQTKPTKKSQR